MSINTGAAHAVAAFGRNERGSIAMLFGLMIMVVMSIAGLALDYGRILLARHALTDAVDAAGLAAGRALMDGKLTAAEVDTMARVYFDQNAKDLAKVQSKIPVPSIVPNLADSTVTVSANVDVPMTLMAIAGFKKVNVPVTSTISFDSKDLEVGMALDITGSMGETPKGGSETKIKSLRGAATRFVETLIPTTPQAGRSVRIGIAPFSASVNLGKFAAKASANQSIDGCVTERRTATYSAALPSSLAMSFDVKADGVKDIDPTEQGVGLDRYVCPEPELIPLTDSRTALTTSISKFKADGYTAGHMGTQWGWNLIAEEYATFWGAGSAPAPYADTKGSKPKLIKAVILMSDGIFNTAFHHDDARKQALAMCTAMKKENVIIFTIGFGLGNTGSEVVAKQTLKDCATPGDQYAVNAANGTELDTALQSFAQVLTQLRVSK